MKPGCSIIPVAQSTLPLKAAGLGTGGGARPLTSRETPLTVSSIEVPIG